MDTQIKALETLYSGTRFRSRTEARWAVFFDAMGLRWQYEPEGYDLGDGLWYLPDFFLPDLDLFIEVKPPLPMGDGVFFAGPSEEMFEKVRRFQYLLTPVSSADEAPWPPRIVMLCGAPGPMSLEKLYGDAAPYQGFIVGDSSRYWCECVSCGAVGIQFDGRADRNKHKQGCRVESTKEGRGHNLDSPRLLAAYEAACNARFERPT